MLPKLLVLLSFSLWLWGEAHILVYHRFEDPRHPSTNTSLAQLRKDFTYLKTHGYRVIPLQRLVQALRDGEAIDPKWVVITIDDGFRSFLKALPLFQEFGYPFTLFIATKPIEGKYPDFLRWEEVRMIANYGEIGLHSHAHPHLCSLSTKQIIEDTKRAKTLFQRRLGFLPTSYAYPYGEYDRRVATILKDLGFTTLCNQNLGAIGSRSDLLDLNRIAMVGKSNLPWALSIKDLPVEWIAPSNYPSDGILKRIEARIDPDMHWAELYVSGHGWRRVRVHEGHLLFQGKFPLHTKRVRVIIKGKNSKMGTKILVRSRHGAE
ncbi:MAG: polysaccharide deacetylase [Nitratiruptor sp.]|nr:polysaccharide deacetylase [Nitratiruptor sp.]NPA83123.1 polysaccharide deacetylase family protein [Campylobacterota bacterium]